MKDSFHQSKKNENRSIANDSIQKKSNQDANFVDNSPEAIQMRQFQANVNNSEEVRQMMSYQDAAYQHETAQLQENKETLPKQKNNTGLPDNLKSGIENLSGYSMDDVKVHYNSDKPAQLQAHAYAQGTDIHLASGQEKHLPHEAWHVVQQKQGRVKPTMQMKSKVNVNDDSALEKEADVMGTKALHFIDKRPEVVVQRKLKGLVDNSSPAQLKIERGKFNVIGERHDDYNGKNPRFPLGRSDEQKFLKDRFGLDQYWTEEAFKGEEKTSEGKSKRADPIIEHVRVQVLGLISTIMKEHQDSLSQNDTISQKVIDGIVRYWESINGGFLAFFGPGLIQEGYDFQDKEFPVEPDEKDRLQKLAKLVEKTNEKIKKLVDLKTSEKDKWFDFTKKRNKENQQKHLKDIGQLLHEIDMGMGDTIYKIGETDTVDAKVNTFRETAMIGAAERAAQNGYVGAWKVGNSHIKNMLNEKGPHLGTKGKQFTITERLDYWSQFDSEMSARDQHEKDKIGGLALIPGETAREISTPESSIHTGAKKEKNVNTVEWNDSKYSGK